MPFANLSKVSVLAFGLLASSAFAQSSGPEISGRQDAEMIVQTTKFGQKADNYSGDAVWSLYEIPVAGADVPEVDVDVRIPGYRLEATLVIRRDVLAGAGYSWIVTFRTDEREGSQTVVKASSLSLRADDQKVGTALSGMSSSGGTNSFFGTFGAGRARTKDEAKLVAMDWIDVPVMLSDGRVAKLGIAKGRVGEKALAALVGRTPPSALAEVPNLGKAIPAK